MRKAAAQTRVTKAKRIFRELYPLRSCEGPCPGWAHMESGHGDEIQRCDTCKRFPNDDVAALCHAIDCGCSWGS
jgi:hypothetical protein